MARIWDFILLVGADPKKLRLRQHLSDEKSHYAFDTWDLDAKYSFGWKEVIGCADRGDYDLKRHMESSKQDLTYFDEESRERVIPHVIEPSPGVDRIVYLALEHGFKKEKERTVFRLPAYLAPITVGVFPLVSKQGMPKLAKKVCEELRSIGIRAFYDESGSIGKRYRRMDEIGTPFCVTVDGKTLENKKVTVRHRDSMKQQRIKISELRNFLCGKLY
jgi:glycyl-tRNA synthetase